MRMVVVSNRLSLVLEPKDGNWHVRPANGGLVTALAGLMRERKGVWIGWPGVTDQDPADMERPLAEYSREAGYEFVPVVLSSDEIHGFYHGFATAIFGTVASAAIAERRDEIAMRMAREIGKEKRAFEKKELSEEETARIAGIAADALAEAYAITGKQERHRKIEEVAEAVRSSFTEEIGLKNSSLARRLAFTPFSLARRSRRTSGVLPIVSTTEL